MRTASIPAVRVSSELREAAEEVLQSGETLSSFVEEAVRLSVEFRRAQQAFITRGLASSQAAKETGNQLSSAEVLGKLARRLDKVRKSSRHAVK
jgi:predicted transcriptional regulator